MSSFMPIAERAYRAALSTLTGAERRELAVHVAVAAPVRDPRGEWSCTIRVDDRSGRRERPIFGIDGWQALSLALQSFATLLVARRHVLAWGRDGRGQIGLPYAPQLNGKRVRLPEALWELERARVEWWSMVGPRAVRQLSDWPDLVGPPPEERAATASQRARHEAGPIVLRRFVEKGRPLIASVSAPRQLRGRWIASYGIEGPEPRCAVVSGRDSMEALVSAMDALRRRLEARAARLRSFGGPGTTGLERWCGIHETRVHELLEPLMHAEHVRLVALYDAANAARDARVARRRARR